jgi:hypothetical protein
MFVRIGIQELHIDRRHADAYLHTAILLSFLPR